MKYWSVVAALFVCVLSARSIKAQEASSKVKTKLAGAGQNGSADTIPPGTTITAQNWQEYQQFMPDGMIALFQGKYYWKMPGDVRIEVGPTVVRQLPATYLSATERYSQQVKIVELPIGGLTLANYYCGMPFS